MKLALLCDYGLDDALATLYLLKNADKFEQIDILPIAGNFPLKTSMKNAKRLLSYVEHLPPNIRLVETSAITQPEEFLPQIHGNDGIGDILAEGESFSGKVIDYYEWVETLDLAYTIVSLGPCTVTEDILNKTGERALLLMGGNISEKPNYGAFEFNHGMDVKAFSKCIKQEHRIATLDTCHCFLCDFNHINLEGDGLFERMVKRAVQLSNERGEKGCYIYDLITVSYLLHPEKFCKEVKMDAFGNTLNVLKYIDTLPIM